MSDELKGVLGAWQGGPCPQCGEDVPANVVHCRNCRTLLNSELTEDSIEIPAFIPLPEIQQLKMVKTRGHYVSCPGCRKELRINSKYFGAAVACKFCSQSFQYDDSVNKFAMYAACPHCEKELRADVKYAGQNVACRFCKGPLTLES